MILNLLPAVRGKLLRLVEIGGFRCHKFTYILRPPRIIIQIAAKNGLPAAGCTLWPPNHKFVTVATIAGSDALSGLASLNVSGTSNEPMNPSDPDIIISGSGIGPRTVQLRADRQGTGTGRVYTLTTTACRSVRPKLWRTSLQM